MKTTAELIRSYRGPAIFSFGFRPFFLLAAVWAALAVPLWWAAVWTDGSLLPAVLTREWHLHEMLFGYAGAVIVGYMIIAGANWTGRYPVAGRPVIALVALWVAGRLAMLTIHVLGGIAAVIDVSFLLLFAAALWREQLAARNGRNLLPCVVITLLAVANVGFHLRPLWESLSAASERLALGLIVLLISVMGGRLVPSFTRNAMAQRKAGPEPAPYDRLDVAAAAVTAGGVVLWLMQPWSMITGVALVTAGLGNLMRLSRWRGWHVLADAMTLSLHLGYLWLAIGLLLLGLSILDLEDVPYTSAIHALGVGAIGVTTLAVMTRTSRSHTGRARRADGSTALIYVLINAAAILRVLAPVLIDLYAELLALSALCWSSAFGLFVLAYGPMLIGGTGAIVCANLRHHRCSWDHDVERSPCCAVQRLALSREAGPSRRRLSRLVLLIKT